MYQGCGALNTLVSAGVDGSVEKRYFRGNQCVRIAVIPNKMKKISSILLNIHLAMVLMLVAIYKKSLIYEIFVKPKGQLLERFLFLSCSFMISHGLASQDNSPREYLKILARCLHKRWGGITIDLGKFNWLLVAMQIDGWLLSETHLVKITNKMVCGICSSSNSVQSSFRQPWSQLK